MLRDNLAGLIEPMSDGAGAQALVVVQKAKNGGCYALPSWQSSILGHPGGKFFAAKRALGKRKKNGLLHWPLRLMTLALSAPNRRKVIGR